MTHDQHIAIEAGFPRRLAFLESRTQLHTGQQ
jgi:hypothetical protein